LNANQSPVVKLAGKKIHVAYDSISRIASVELNLKPGQLQQIEIN